MKILNSVRVLIWLGFEYFIFLGFENWRVSLPAQLCETPGSVTAAIRVGLGLRRVD